MIINDLFLLVQSQSAYIISHIRLYIHIFFQRLFHKSKIIKNIRNLFEENASILKLSNSNPLKTISNDKYQSKINSQPFILPFYCNKVPTCLFYLRLNLLKNIYFVLTASIKNVLIHILQHSIYDLLGTFDIKCQIYRIQFKSAVYQYKTRYICNQMQQFKFEEKQADLSCLGRFSSDQLSLLNSRKRLKCEISQRESQLDRQNDEEIRQFKREIEERFKLSIANKIYTFPKIIRSLHDIISSEEEEDTLSQQQDRVKVYDKVGTDFTKKNNNIYPQTKNKHPQSKVKVNDSTIRLYESGKGVESAKKGNQKLRTNDSTGKRREDEPKEKGKIAKMEKAASGKKQKKKGDRLKTEQQASSSFLQTLRSKPGKKN